NASRSAARSSLAGSSPSAFASSTPRAASWASIAATRSFSTQTSCASAITTAKARSTAGSGKNVCSGFIGTLERLDLGKHRQGQADRVHAVEQHIAEEGVDDERVPPVHELRLEIHRDLGAGRAGEPPPQLVAGRGRQARRHDAVLQAVVEEDVAEARRDDGA